MFPRTRYVVLLGLLLIVQPLAAGEVGTEGEPQGMRIRSAVGRSGGTGPAVERIERLLDTPVSLSFDRVPLDQFVASLRARTGMNIRIDRPALDADGIGLDAPVTVTLRGVRLRSVLNLALHDLKLVWLVHREVVLITTPKVSESLLTTQAHDVTDLLASYGQQGGDDLVELISTTVEPDTWDEVGGAGSIEAFGGPRRMVLVISQTWDVHHKVAALLDSLRAFAASRTGPGGTARRGHRRSSVGRPARRYVTAPSWSVPRIYD